MTGPNCKRAFVCNDTVIASARPCTTIMERNAREVSTVSWITHSASDPLLELGSSFTDQQPSSTEILQFSADVHTAVSISAPGSGMHRLTSLAVNNLDSVDLLAINAPITTTTDPPTSARLDAVQSRTSDNMPGTELNRAAYQSASGALSTVPANSSTAGSAEFQMYTRDSGSMQQPESTYEADCFVTRTATPKSALAKWQAADNDLSAAATHDQSPRASAVDKIPAASDAPAVAIEQQSNIKGSEQQQTKPHQQKPGFKQGLGCPTGVRVWTDKGIDLSSRQNPLMEAFAIVSMAIYLGWIHVLGLLLVASFFSKTALLVMIGVWCTLLLPAKLLWYQFLSNPVWRAWRRYFRFSVIMDEDMELHDTQYVIPEYPHGVFPLSQLIAISLTDIWPNHPIYSIAADSVFHVPLWKHVMTWIGALPATAKNFKKLLTKGSVGLIPGGIAEMFMVEEDREVIKLLDRKGFVRIAVEMGKPLLPCYHFGNSRLFKWGPKSWEQTARRHRIALGFLFGRWGLPFALPNRVPLMMVVGAPIPVKQTSPNDPGFAAAVDDAHAKLVDAMQQLYDKYKAEYGWADRPLVIK